MIFKALHHSISSDIKVSFEKIFFYLWNFVGFCIPVTWNSTTEIAMGKVLPCNKKVMSLTPDRDNILKTWVHVVLNLMKCILQLIGLNKLKGQYYIHTSTFSLPTFFSMHVHCTCTCSFFYFKFEFKTPLPTKGFSLVFPVILNISKAVLKVKRSQKAFYKGFHPKLNLIFFVNLFLRTNLMKNTIWTLLTYTDFSEKWNGVTHFLTVSCVYAVTESSLFLKTFFAVWENDFC